MSTMHFSTAKCSCCGHENKIRVLTSTNAFGGQDLDLRPPEMKRSTMHLWVHECDNCGFISDNLTKKLPGAEEIIKTDRYRTCDGLNLGHSLRGQFAKYAVMSEMLQDYRNAEWGYTCAAWSCDDMGDKSTAIELRKRAVNAIFSQEKDVKNMKWNQAVILADLLRRSKQFDTVIELFENHKKYNEPHVNEVLDFQVEQSRKQDDERYHFGYNGKIEALPIFEISDDDGDSSLLKKVERFLRDMGNKN